MIKKGFTLIELLVVLAIIALLATIIVINVNNSRSKAKHATIIGSMTALRKAAEISYSIDSNYSAVCYEAGGAAGDSYLSTTTASDYLRISDSVKAQNGGSDVVCNESANSATYAVWSVLPGGNWFCVDSTSIAKTETVATSTNLTACP